MPAVEEPKVARIRQELGLSQQALARVLGVDKRTLQRWEHGSYVRRIYLERLSDMLAARKANGRQS